MKSFRKMLAGLSAAAIAASLMTALPASAAEEKALTKFDVVKAMGVGWNLGNTLDTNGSGSSSETYWGNPKTTKEMIDFVHDQGFQTIRIPVTWGYHMDSDHKIDESYMARVKEVVDYAYDDGMYVIINIHHDNDIKNKNDNYFFPDKEHEEISKTFVSSVWTQVSEVFKDYDEHLVFETLNEPRLIGDNNEWWFTTSNPQTKVKTAIDIINDLNQSAVDIIRASGGSNANRLIMCPGYDASLDGATTPYYKLPKDEADMVAVSVHAYSPYNFAMNENGSAVYTEATRNELMGIIKSVKGQLVDKGNAVVIGEFGATNKKNSEERAKWASDFTGAFAEMGVACCVWDNNAYITAKDNKFNEKFGLIRRSELKVDDQTYLNGLLKAQKSGYTHTFDNGSITVKPTLTSEGKITYTCAVCGEKKEGTLDKLKDITKLSITLDKTSVTYTGSPVKAGVTVKSGSTVLKEGTDYTLGYKDNIKIGEAAVIIRGRGVYGGEKKLTYKIVGTSIKTATVTGIKNKYYTGKAVTQALTVKVGSKTLKNGTDYTVTYKNNKAIGKATVTVTGKGAYTGSISKTFKIVPKKTTVKKVTSPKTKQLKVTYSKVSNITGYQITYSTSSKFTKAATKSVTSKTTSKTIGKLKKGKTYYVKVRTYKTVSGVKYYSGYTAVKKIKVK